MSIKKSGPSYVAVGRPIKTNGVSLSNNGSAAYGNKLYGSPHAKWGQQVDLGDAVSAPRMPTGSPVGGMGGASTAKVSGKGGVSRKG